MNNNVETVIGETPLSPAEAIEDISDPTTNVETEEGEPGEVSWQRNGIRATEMFRQKCHAILTKHRLAAIHFASLHFWTFTIPVAIISMTDGILAFLATSGLFGERRNSILNVLVGSLSFLVVFLQTLASQLDYDNRAKIHKNTATNIVNRENEEDIDEENQKRYIQWLEGGKKSTVPLAVNEAFSLLDSMLNTTMSAKAHRILYNKYGKDYNNKIYFLACDDLGPFCYPVQRRLWTRQ